MSTSPDLNPALDTPLARLLLAAGWTFTAVSGEIPDCPVLLLDRIALRRQPFPLLLVSQVSIVTGIDQGSLLAATGLWSPNSGPRTRVPVPPDPLLGDPIPPFIGFQTLPLVFPPPTAQAPDLWVVGNGLGVASAPGAKAIRRTSGVTVGQVTFTDVVTPIELAFDGAAIWTFGFMPSGPDSFFARIDPTSRTLIAEVDATFSAFVGVCFEPVRSEIWACPQVGLNAVFQFNADGTHDGVLLAIGPNNFDAVDVVATAGSLFVAASRPTGNPLQPFEGRIFEVDPVGHNLVRSSTGQDLGNVLGIGADDAGNLWTCSRSGGGLIPPMVVKTPISSFVSADVPLIGGTLTDPLWFEFLLGRYWVVESDDATSGILYEIDAGGVVLQQRTFGSGAQVGHVTADANFLWYADKSGGLVHMLDPNDISVSPVTVSVGGLPDGLLVLG